MVKDLKKGFSCVSRAARREDIDALMLLDQVVYSGCQTDRKEWKQYVKYFQTYVIDVVNHGVMAYMILRDCRRHRTRHVVNIAVHPEYRRCGLGTILLSAALDDLSTVDRAVALVPEDTLPAQCLFRECGFEALPVVVEEGFANCDSKGYFFQKHSSRFVTSIDQLMPENDYYVHFANDVYKLQVVHVDKQSGCGQVIVAMPIFVDGKPKKTEAAELHFGEVGFYRVVE